MPAWYGFAKNPMDSLSSWDTALTKGSKWGFNVIRLVIRHSTINYTQLEMVLEKIDAFGAKAILDNHLLSQWVTPTGADPRFGTKAMRDRWVEMVTRYKDDPRIIAWEIANEPFANVWDGVNVQTDADVPKEFAIITDLIRAIDPNRPIIVMIPHNVSPGSYLRPNWVASFHPYTYGDLMTQAEAQAILNYRISQMNTTMGRGYSAGWCGELECHPSGTTPLSIEKWYVSSMLAYVASKGYGWNYWKYYNSVDDAGANPDEVIQTSGFIGLYPDKPYVDGLTLKDPKGKVLNLAQWNIRDYFTEEDIKWLANKEYNGIRLVVYWSSTEQTEGAVNWTNLDNTINWATKYGLWVILDFHQWAYSPFFKYDFDGNGTIDTGGGFPTWLVQAGGYTNNDAGKQAFSDDLFLKRGYGATSWAKFMAFNEKLVKRYCHYPRVWAWEFNEPTVGAEHVNEARTALTERYKEILTMIRSIDPKMVFIAHNIDRYYNKSLEPHKNIIWSKSAYREYGAGDTRAKNDVYFTNRSDEFNTGLGKPYMISETGVLPGGESYANQWLTDLMASYKSHCNNGNTMWAVWLYSKAYSVGGYKPPRNADGTDSWIQPMLANFLPPNPPIPVNLTLQSNPNVLWSINDSAFVNPNGVYQLLPGSVKLAVPSTVTV